MTDNDALLAIHILFFELLLALCYSIDIEFFLLIYFSAYRNVII